MLGEIKKMKSQNINTHGINLDVRIFSYYTLVTRVLLLS